METVGAFAAVQCQLAVVCFCLPLSMMAEWAEMNLLSVYGECEFKYILFLSEILFW